MAYLPLDTRNRWFNILWNENLQKVHIKAGDIHVFINLKTGVITIQWGGGEGGKGENTGRWENVLREVGHMDPLFFPPNPHWLWSPHKLRKLA